MSSWAGRAQGPTSMPFFGNGHPLALDTLGTPQDQEAWLGVFSRLWFWTMGPRQASGWVFSGYKDQKQALPQPVA